MFAILRKDMVLDKDIVPAGSAVLVVCDNEATTEIRHMGEMFFVDKTELDFTPVRHDNSFDLVKQALIDEMRTRMAQYVQYDGYYQGSDWKLGIVKIGQKTGTGHNLREGEFVLIRLGHIEFKLCLDVAYLDRGFSEVDTVNVSKFCDPYDMSRFMILES
jgi:hypothetical protein